MNKNMYRNFQNKVKLYGLRSYALDDYHTFVNKNTVFFFNKQDIYVDNLFDINKTQNILSNLS